MSQYQFSHTVVFLCHKMRILCRVLICLCTPIFTMTAGFAQYAENGNGTESELVNPANYEKYDTDVIPFSLVKMHPSASPFAFVVDKRAQQLYLYKYDGKFHLVRTFTCTTGKNPGIKQVNGDKKTPEGVYFFTRTFEKEDLNKMYGSYAATQFGIRAFNMDYPNPVDQILNRQGSNIWMHGTDEPERADLPHSTRGCVVMRNADIKMISPLIAIEQTPIIIVDYIEFVDKNDLLKDYTRIADFFKKWRNSWENRDYQSYASCYSPLFQSDYKKLQNWLIYKKQTLKNYNWIVIDLLPIRILRGKDYYYVELLQIFHADNYKDTGIKKLFILEKDGDFKIANEEWFRISADTAANLCKTIFSK